MSIEKAGYDVSAGDDMTGHGWVKAITWLDVRKGNGGEWTVTEYDFEVGNYQCHSCKSNEFMWLILQSNGVYLACTGCKEVDGPLTKDGAIRIGTRNVQPEEALDILEKRGVRKHMFELPAGLLDDIKRRRARTFRQKGKHKRPRKQG